MTASPFSVGSTETTDVVVVGGGILGAATLFELARRGIKGMLVERESFASASTGKSAAIVRTNYSNPAVVRMAVASRDVFRSFADVVGGEDVYHECGWLFAAPPSMRDRVSAAFEMNRAEGVDVRRLTVDEARGLLPGLWPDDVAAIYLEPLSGCANPIGATRGYIEAARRLGATASEGVEVKRLLRRGDRIVGVETAFGRIESGTVVLAAGPWSAKLAATVDLSLPYKVTREEEIYVQGGAGQIPEVCFSNAVDAIYLRPIFEHPARASTCMIVGRGYPKEYESVDPDSYDDQPSQEFELDVLSRLKRRLPPLQDVAVVGAVVGLYAVTPDWHPYLGPVGDFDGLVLATGGSGHCFKLGPAIGDMVASGIAEDVDAPFAPLSDFSVDRFQRNAAFGAAIGGNRA